MNSQGEVVSLLDLLDLDEELIDTRLKSIMLRSNYTNEHLANALQLLRYKQLINTQDNTDCNNENEFNFVAKLIRDICTDTVENVCKITNTVLELNTATLVSYSEHLLLQILSNLDVEDSNSESPLYDTKALLLLKVCDVVLDVTMKHGEKPSLIFLESPLEAILSCNDELLKVHFITSTVPKLMEGAHGYDILSRIWNYLEGLNADDRSVALKVLSSLSDYYLPVSISGNAKYVSTIVFQYNFWDIVLYGLMSEDPLLRKMSVYLAKRAVDYVRNLNKTFHVKSDVDILFSWESNKQEAYKSQWDNFFILIDSLEEQQSNIVLPSLQLFDTLIYIHHKWLRCAYNLGLKHDNGQVRLRCIEYRIKTKLNCDSEAVMLLEALNDINFYENRNDYQRLKDKLSKFLRNNNDLAHVLKAIPLSHLSPVPFYYLSDIIANIDSGIESKTDFNVTKTVIDILKTSCNNVAMREAIHYNIANFFGKSCKNMHWRDFAHIYAFLKTGKWKKDNAIFELIRNLELEDKDEFYKYITESQSNVDFVLIYLNNHEEDIDRFMDIIFKKGKTIQDVVNRQYANKMGCFDNVMYILTLQNNCNETIKELLPNAHKMILHYVSGLLPSDVHLDIDKVKPLFNRIHYMQESYLNDIVLQLYKTAVIILKDPLVNLEKMVQSMFVIDSLTHNYHFVNNFIHEMLDLKQLLQIESAFEQKAVANAHSLGRLRNTFYEIHCKLVSTNVDRIISTAKRNKTIVDELVNKDYKLSENKTDWNEIHKTDQDILLKTNKQEVNEPQNLKNSIELNEKPDWKDIVDYVEKVIDCGGYGCLEWVLRIINESYEHTNSHLDINQFIKKTWNEIEELKSSNHYLPCMKEFVNFLTQKALVSNPEFNNIIILYFSRIIEYGFINNSPLYYLVYNAQFCKFFEGKSKKDEYGHLVYVLSEILLFCPVPRKDQRIADNLTLEIINKYGEEFIATKQHFNFAIQYEVINILSKIGYPDLIQTLTTFIKAKIDQTFKAKFRYHGNSQVHRTLQTALSHLLYMKFLKANVEDSTEWYIDLLGRMPHQPSVRVCLEWHVALEFYRKKMVLDQNLVNLLQSKNVPLTSQMTIIYWLITRKFETTRPEDEFHFAMRTLLSHTMGQMFNIRLLAQYLTLKLHNGPNAPYSLNTEPIYDTIIHVINKTLQDNANDKSLSKLKEDYFMNEFNIVTHLTPLFIYHVQPRLCEIGSNEDVDLKSVSKLMDGIMKNTKLNIDPKFKEEWEINYKADEDLVNLEINKRVCNQMCEDLEAVGTIQKKYIPWKNMSDINVYNIEKKRESPSDLIVVASLIDKLPNLGGMARTSEVFGVKTYVIDSLRHVQDRQFQGLSVSAERWVDVEEVRPGPPLKEYLNRKKAEGYSVVAAEQTSTSSKLQTFKFPRKTLLLLGHEKEGIPCDLLPMMDHCVEIPQQGFVRSLNVHVTAAIFIWEYARQIFL